MSEATTCPVCDGNGKIERGFLLVRLVRVLETERAEVEAAISAVRKLVQP